ncbi:polymorphic toxin type 15 domain-containing protein [Cellulomonas sp. URHB0016]
MAQAERQMSDQAALHGPDQRPGGNPLQFTGMGDRGVNSSYGWGWGRGGNAVRLRRQMDLLLDSVGLPDELLGDVRMNVRIVVQDGLP